MIRYSRLLLVVLCTCFLVSCQRIRQYPRAAPAKQRVSESEVVEKLDLRLSWAQPNTPLPDLPIVFVPSSSKDEWHKLKTFWNDFPLQPEGIRMHATYFGLPPMQAFAVLLLNKPNEAIKIKVPLGLPDPTPYLPPSNPPTFRKWQLGRRLFFEQSLPGNASCAHCHDPRQGFTANLMHPPGGSINTLSLINVVYNRRQFWDGRVQTLEETIVRGLEDERQGDHQEKGLEHHRWGGFVRALVNQKNHDRDFQAVFGVEHPTQDTVAKALGTYLRTILAGNSLYDRADKRKKGTKLTPEDFQAALEELTGELQEVAKDKVNWKTVAEHLLQDPEVQKRKGEEMPALLVKGHELFHGKARCSVCHHGPLFTDQDYHNVGYPDPEGAPIDLKKETGRSLHVPIGQKEGRLIGAYRTPTLRNLVQTKPYFHDGSLTTLPAVIDFYNEGVIYTPYLARQLSDAEQVARRLNLDKNDKDKRDERDALLIFLRSLDGLPVDPIVALPPLR